MNEKISLRVLKILLTPKEMKNITGGLDFRCYCACDGNFFDVTAPTCMYASLDAAASCYSCGSGGAGCMGPGC